LLLVAACGPNQILAVQGEYLCTCSDLVYGRVVPSGCTFVQAGYASHQFGYERQGSESLSPNCVCNHKEGWYLDRKTWECVREEQCYGLGE
jgi:hypothetical protein